jgi:plastocyanin
LVCASYGQWGHGKHAVDVGAEGEFLFSPNQVAASAGDVIRFNFLARNHTLTQSSLDAPCSQSGQFDSGFNQFNPLNISNQFHVDYEVKSSDPVWFYW